MARPVLTGVDCTRLLISLWDELQNGKQKKQKQNQKQNKTKQNKTNKQNLP